MKKLAFEKGKNGVIKHKYALCLFMFVSLYHIIFVNRIGFGEMNQVTFPSYCVDFSFGFATKLLPGAVFRLLFGSFASTLTVRVYVNVLLFLFFAVLSLMLEKLLLRVSPQYRVSAVVLILLFLSGPYTFAIFSKWVGILDSYWLFIAALFVIFLEHKRLWLFIPLCFILAIFIHFSAMIFYIPLFCLLLLYRVAISAEKKEKKQLTILLLASVLFAVVLSVFFLIYESRFICSIEEFHRKLQENGTESFVYHDYAFYKIINGQAMIPADINNMPFSFMKIILLIYHQIMMNFSLLIENMESAVYTFSLAILILSPILYYFMRFYTTLLRKKQSKLKRFCSVLMIIQFPVMFILAILFGSSTDITRQLTHTFLILFVCILYRLYHEPEAGECMFETVNHLQSLLPFQIYYLAYFCVTIMPAK